MKLGFLIFSSFMHLSCEKPHEMVYYNGSASAMKNGQVWEAKVHGGTETLLQDRFGLVIHRFNSANILQEELYLMSIPKMVGTYRIYPMPSSNQISLKTLALYGTLIADGDVGCDNYSVVETDSISNFVTVEQFNSATGEIRGNFETKLIIRLPRCSLTAPDTVSFQKGEFITRI